MNLSVLLLSKGNRSRYLQVLLLAATTFTSSCSTYRVDQSETTNKMWVKSLPPFPAPAESVVDELKEVCPNPDKVRIPPKCHALYDWIDRVLKFEKEMALYNEQ
jgi:hypothetical protein